MLDGNSAAELANDQPLGYAEVVRRNETWAEVRDSLLAGNVEKNAFGQEFTLSVRLGEEYQEFSDLIDQNFDIMAAYNNGELHPDVRELIRNEANTLASIVVG